MKPRLSTDAGTSPFFKTLKIICFGVISLCILLMFLEYIELDFASYFSHFFMEGPQAPVGSLLKVASLENWSLIATHYENLGNDSAQFNLFMLRNNITCNEPTVNRSEFENVPQISENECSYPYVEIEDNGRLGNQICQYMSLWIFRKHFGVRVFISNKTFGILHKYFSKLTVPLKYKNCSPLKVSSSVEYSYRKIYDNFYDSFSYIRNNQMKSAPLIKRRNFIQGSPCESGLISNYRNELRSELSIDKDIIRSAVAHFTLILSKNQYRRDNITLVSVHVRRTDYIKYTKNHEQILPGRTYFQQIMDSFLMRFDSVVFAIFSDDIEWCKMHLDGPDVIYPGKGGIGNPIFDFALITLCDHHIIGLGTYSFTSAFLGRGSIVYGASRRHIRKTKLGHYLCSSILTPVLIL